MPYWHRVLHFIYRKHFSMYFMRDIKVGGFRELFCRRCDLDLCSFISCANTNTRGISSAIFLGLAYSYRSLNARISNGEQMAANHASLFFALV